MKYSVGDCVKNTVKKKYGNGDIIEIKTSGSVIKVFTLSKSYTVDFEGAKIPHRVLETQLTACS